MPYPRAQAYKACWDGIRKLVEEEAEMTLPRSGVINISVCPWYGKPQVRTDKCHYTGGCRGESGHGSRISE
jgi:hypothetical protein